jgi:uncharacterized protein
MFWAWIGALLVGLTLGLLGSGGSILTVPVLVYLVDEPEKLAIAESLGIVALISLIGAIPFAFKRQVNWRSVVLFGVPGMAGAYLGAYLSVFMSGALQLAIFAGVMLVAAVMMLRQQSGALGKTKGAYPAWRIVVDGFVVGVLTGIVGVGGGFLIVPALVLFVGLPMHQAIGTSLTIIAVKSLAGFYKYLDVLEQANLTVHWRLILIFSAIGIAGSFVGGKMGEYISQQRLKRIFAVFLIVMGLYILGRNLLLLGG